MTGTDAYLHHTVRERKLILQDCGRGGDSLFAALAHVVLGSVSLHRVVRQTICDTLLNSSALKTQFLASEGETEEGQDYIDAGDLEGYVALLHQPGIPGDNLELAAASVAYKRKIIVLSHEEPQVVDPSALGITCIRDMIYLAAEEEEEEQEVESFWRWYAAVPEYPRHDGPTTELPVPEVRGPSAEYQALVALRIEEMERTEKGLPPVVDEKHRKRVWDAFIGRGVLAEIKKKNDLDKKNDDKDKNDDKAQKNDMDKNNEDENNDEDMNDEDKDAAPAPSDPPGPPVEVQQANQMPVSPDSRRVHFADADRRTPVTDPESDEEKDVKPDQDDPPAFIDEEQWE